MRYVVLLVSLLGFPHSAFATAVTLGRINCTQMGKHKQPIRLRLHWGQSCAPGGPCGSMMGIKLHHKGKTHDLTPYPRMSPEEKRTLARWFKKVSKIYPFRRTNLGKPPRRFKVKERWCTVGKALYFRYTFRDWKKRFTHIEITPRKGGYMLRVHAAYNKKARTRGWKKTFSCTFMSHRRLKPCKASKRRKRR